MWHMAAENAKPVDDGIMYAFTAPLLYHPQCAALRLMPCRLHIPRMHLHAEEIVLSLVRMRRKQLAMAAAVERARNASPGSGDDADDGPDGLAPDQISP